MPRCTRKGCGIEFTEGGEELCNYHPGVPVSNILLNLDACVTCVQLGFS